MPSLNKVFLAGNLTRNPELRYTPGGTAVAQFGMAVNRRFRNRDGQMQEEATFVDIEVWGRQAETASEYLSKGSPVLVEGRLKLDTWESKQTGERRSKLRVVGERVQFLGSRPRGEGREGGRGRRSDSRGSGRGERRPDSRGGDSRGRDSRGGDSRGRDSRGGDSRGRDSQGGDSREKDSREPPRKEDPPAGGPDAPRDDEKAGGAGAPRDDKKAGDPPPAGGGLPPDDDIPF
ncbi:MAG: single-stranded DNA-binding protein [Planctomycetota bacterium]|jgi:single-strand DNA-binding protein